MMGPDDNARFVDSGDLSISDFNVSSHPLGGEFQEDQDLEPHASSSNSVDWNTDEDDDYEPLFAATSTQEVVQEEQSGDYINVFVSQPKKELDASSSSFIPGGSYFVTYLVTTKTNIPEYEESEMSVRRRFKDIVALADTLHQKYRGYFIPSRPDKGIVESQIMDKHEFIEQRMLAIERYLRRLAAHPVLRKSEELRAFLVSKGKLPFVPSLDVASRMLDGAKHLFGDANSPPSSLQSAKGGLDLIRLFKDLKQSVTSDWSSTRPLVVEEDKDFLERREKILEYDRRLLHVGQQADLLLKAQRNLSAVMGELGLSFVKVGKFETQQALNAAAEAYSVQVRNLATASLRAGRLLRGGNVQAQRYLVQFHEHAATLQSANNAFVDRSNALVTVQTLLSDIAIMHSKAEKHSVAAHKVFGGDKSNKKVDDLKEGIKATEEACQHAQQQFNEIQDRNRVEIDRIEKEKEQRYLSMLQGFVHSQVGYAEKLSKEWTELVEKSMEHSQRRLMFKSSPSF